MTTKLGVILADFTTNLATAIAIGGTTATLQTATDDDGVALPSGRYFFAIDGENSNKEHFSCQLSGTALTSLASLSRQGVETSGAVRAHRIGATVTLTDFAHIKYINDLLIGTTTLEATTPLGYNATASITTANQLATKAYVDGVALVSAPKADASTFGVSKLTLTAASPTNPLVVGDNDPRLPTQNENDALVGTSGTAVSSTNKLVDAADKPNIMAPVGMIAPFAGSSAPAGWLVCDGSAVSQSIYSTLYALIGTTYGNPGGGNFNLPNLKGSVVVGYDATQTEFNTIAKTGGEKTHTLILSEAPAHAHNTPSGSNGIYSYGATIKGITASNVGADDGTLYANGIPMDSQGGGGAHNNLQPYMALNYIIKY